MHCNYETIGFLQSHKLIAFESVDKNPKTNFILTMLLYTYFDVAEKCKILYKAL